MTVLTFLGAAAFWLANLAVSLTPIAAEYRAVVSISYLPMLLEALLGGLILAFGVSILLTRFADKLPGRDAHTDLRAGLVMPSWCCVHHQR